MPDPTDEAWFDNDAGPLLRPYSLTDGRTEASVKLSLQSLVRSTGKFSPNRVEPTHASLLQLCRNAISVAEVSAHLGQSVAVAKVLLSDLIEMGALTTQALDPEIPSIAQLEALLDGLQRL